MNKGAYYNEVDAYAAQWLRNLIAARLIPAGDVDERSIVDVRHDDLLGYGQCHFFAGIGGWALGCRLAEWPDDRPIWTGSAPCQGESVAGKRLGAADPRHLWPAWFPLIQRSRPAVVVGEQVARAAGTHWLDGVCADLEAAGYAVRAAVVPACAVDAPHRRDRLWFVADASGNRRDRQRREFGQQSGAGQRWSEPADSGSFALAHSHGRGSQGAEPVGSQARVARRFAYPRDANGHVADADSGRWIARRVTAKAVGHGRSADAARGNDALADAIGGERDRRAGVAERRPQGRDAVGRAGEVAVGDADASGSPKHPGQPGDARPQQPPAIGAGWPSAWSGAEWVAGADGKARRVGAGVRLLAHGVSGRVAVCRPGEPSEATVPEEHWISRTGALRAFGNAIVPQVAAEVIAAWMECEP